MLESVQNTAGVFRIISYFFYSSTNIKSPLAEVEQVAILGDAVMFVSVGMGRGSLSVGDPRRGFPRAKTVHRTDFRSPSCVSLTLLKRARSAACSFWSVSRSAERDQRVLPFGFPQAFCKRLDLKLLVFSLAKIRNPDMCLR